MIIQKCYFYHFNPLEMMFSSPNLLALLTAKGKNVWNFVMLLITSLCVCNLHVDNVMWAGISYRKNRFSLFLIFCGYSYFTLYLVILLLTSTNGTNLFRSHSVLSLAPLWAREPIFLATHGTTCATGLLGPW